MPGWVVSSGTSETWCRHASANTCRVPFLLPTSRETLRWLAEFSTEHDNMNGGKKC